MSCELKRKASEPVEDGTKKVRFDSGNSDNGDLQEAVGLEDTEELGEILVDAQQRDVEQRDVEQRDGEQRDSKPAALLGRQFVLNCLGLSNHKGSWDQILLGLINDVDIKGSLEDFLYMQQHTKHPTSGKDMDEFLTSNSVDWEDHDPEVTARFNEFKIELSALLGPEYDKELFSKPSGPASAVLGIMWHYPTMVTEKPCWGHTMDKTNPSMRVQYRKVGPNPSVLTSDRFPMRMNWSRSNNTLDKLAKNHPNWDRIDAACVKFQKDLNATSPFIILVGGEALGQMDRLIKIEPDHEAVQVPLDLNMVSVFGKGPEIVVVRHRITHAIRQVVFTSYHGQTFLYGGDNQITVAYHDLLWNAALQLSGLDIKAEDSFSALARGVASHRQPGGRYGSANMAVFLRAQEISKNFTYPESVVRQIFQKSFKQGDLPSVDHTGSHVARVLRMFAANAHKYSPTHRKRFEILAKVDALFRSKQGKQLLAKEKRPHITFEDWCDKEAAENPDFGSLSIETRREIWDNDHAPVSFREYSLLELRKEYLGPYDHYHICERVRKALDEHAVFYSKSTPGGLRWEGDEGPGDDSFDHDNDEHPAVYLDSILTVRQKERFRETGSFW